MAPSRGNPAGKVYSLTDKGRDALRQLTLARRARGSGGGTDAAAGVAVAIAGYLLKHNDAAPRLIRGLEKKGFLHAEAVEAQRDPLRAPSAKLRVELVQAPPREGTRRRAGAAGLSGAASGLAQSEGSGRCGGEGGRSGARAGRRGLLALKTELSPVSTQFARPPHVLNPHQQRAFDEIRAAMEAGQCSRSCCKG